MPSIGALSVELAAGELDICNSPAFEGCSEDSNVTASGRPAPSRFSAPTNSVLATLGLPVTSSFGSGVTVALIDSGIYNSWAFAGRIKAFYDFTTGGTVSRLPFDDYGHGTHVAGLIGGLQSDPVYEGVAPSVLRRSEGPRSHGGGRTSDVIRAIEFAIANKARFGIDIINLSLGHPIFEPAATDPLVQAVEKGH